MEQLQHGLSVKKKKNKLWNQTCLSNHDWHASCLSQPRFPSSLMCRPNVTQHCHQFFHSARIQDTDCRGATHTPTPPQLLLLLHIMYGRCKRNPKLDTPAASASSIHSDTHRVFRGRRGCKMWNISTLQQAAANLCSFGDNRRCWGAKQVLTAAS